MLRLVERTRPDEDGAHSRGMVFQEHHAKGGSGVDSRNDHPLGGSVLLLEELKN